MSTLIKDKHGKILRYEENSGIYKTIVNFITDKENLKKIQGSVLYHDGDAYPVERLLMPVGLGKDMKNSDFDKHKL